MRERDMATNRFRLGALNRGNFGHFRAEVISIRTQDGQIPLIARTGWPIPWLDDGSVISKAIPMAASPRLDFAHFNLPNLREDLEGTKWLNGNHWTFPSLPDAINVSYSVVRTWAEQDDHYFIVTVRVIRDDPPGFDDTEFKLGTDGQQPYCHEYTGESSPSGKSATDELVPGPAIIDRWRGTTEDVSTDLMQLQNNVMSHPAYSNRSPQEQPPASVRVGIIIGCEGLAQDTPTTSSIRAAFLSFLGTPEIMELISDLTDVADMTWRARDENPRFNFGAALASNLGLTTSSDPKAEIAIWLKAHGTSLTELVDIEGMTVIPGSPQSNWFMAFAVADAAGQREEALARTWLGQLCDSALHLDGHESA